MSKKDNSDTSKFVTGSLLLKLAEKVVAKYVYANAIPVKEKDDVQMAIVQKFLAKQDKIAIGFKGESKVTTYCIAILSRMCCEIIRREIKNWNVSLSDEHLIGETGHLSTSVKLLVKDEVKTLNRIFLLMGSEYPKLIVFLAFYFKIQPRESDILQYDKNYKQNNLLHLLMVESEMDKGLIFNRLAEVVNNVEKKNVKSDAVRMWLNKSIKQIIIRLNGSFNRANYDAESLQILFEYYYLQGGES